MVKHLISSKIRSSLPYAYARSGRDARDEIIRVLTKLGCTEVGFLDNFEDHTVTLHFKHRSHTVCLRVDAQGWVKLFLRTNPHTSRNKMSREEYEQRIIEQGQISVNSILRDWVKGQVTAIECGIVSFEDVFLPFTMLPSGETVSERVKGRNLLALE
ncbi:MAG: hypothetical protein J2P55_17190 [Rhizobiales bacterium]|nr:hypothetical protein [Hyphomicrobiales bacterium]